VKVLPRFRVDPNFYSVLIFGLRLSALNKHVGLPKWNLILLLYSIKNIFRVLAL